MDINKEALILPATTLRCIIAHEMAHLKNRDHIFSLIFFFTDWICASSFVLLAILIIFDGYEFPLILITILAAGINYLILWLKGDEAEDFFMHLLCMPFHLAFAYFARRYEIRAWICGCRLIGIKEPAIKFLNENTEFYESWDIIKVIALFCRYPQNHAVAKAIEQCKI